MGKKTKSLENSWARIKFCQKLKKVRHNTDNVHYLANIGHEYHKIRYGHKKNLPCIYYNSFILFFLNPLNIYFSIDNIKDLTHKIVSKI